LKATLLDSSYGSLNDNFDSFLSGVESSKRESYSHGWALFKDSPRLPHIGNLLPKSDEVTNKDSGLRVIVNPIITTKVVDAFVMHFFWNLVKSTPEIFSHISASRTPVSLAAHFTSAASGIIGDFDVYSTDISRNDGSTSPMLREITSVQLMKNIVPDLMLRLGFPSGMTRIFLQHLSDPNWSITMYRKSRGLLKNKSPKLFSFKSDRVISGLTSSTTV